MMTGIEYAIPRGYEDTSSCHWILMKSISIYQKIFRDASLLAVGPELNSYKRRRRLAGLNTINQQNIV